MLQPCQLLSCIDSPRTCAINTAIALCRGLTESQMSTSQSIPLADHHTCSMIFIGKSRSGTAAALSTAISQIISSAATCKELQSRHSNCMQINGERLPGLDTPHIQHKQLLATVSCTVLPLVSHSHSSKTSLSPHQKPPSMATPAAECFREIALHLSQAWLAQAFLHWAIGSIC